MDVIEVFVRGERKFVDQAMNWCEENNISVQRYKPVHEKNRFNRSIIIGFNVYFQKEEDAMAFKLKWV